MYARGGIRTHTPSRAVGFKPTASHRVPPPGPCKPTHGRSRDLLATGGILRDTRGMARLTRLGVITAVLLAVCPGSALAQFPGPFGPQVQEEDYGPGITVSGAGFAPLTARDRATARAIGDARR